jgi:hypothetical protein
MGDRLTPDELKAVASVAGAMTRASDKLLDRRPVLAAVAAKFVYETTLEQLSAAERARFNALELE